MKTLSNTADQQELRSRINALTPDAPRQWGTMSALQMMCHLTDSFRQPRDFTPGAHPIFGEMTAAQWDRWAHLHIDHHLRQFDR